MGEGGIGTPVVVPELQYWFNHFVVNSLVNKHHVKFPVSVPQVYLPQKSFIEMLFNENYSYGEYNFLYEEDTNRYGWPYIVRNRLLVYPQGGKYAICSSVEANIFDIKGSDLTFLDALLAYRMDSTAVTIIDSTAIDFISNVLYASYKNISTELSKLIYLYLDFKIYNRYSNYNNTSLVSSGKLLESCYEVYVLDKIFNFVMSKGI